MVVGGEWGVCVRGVSISVNVGHGESGGVWDSGGVG